MAKAVDQFRSSDVTFWGIAALCCGGLAVLSANVSALIPDGVLAGLHSTRLEGGSLNQLRGQIAALEDQAAELKRTAVQVDARLTLKERADNAMTQRMGALEVSLPAILERLPADGIDSSVVTAGIGGGETFDTDGGTVTVQHRPLPPGETASPVSQPMPAEVAARGPDPDAFGLAIGPIVTIGTANTEWQALNAKVGALLLGLVPLVTTSSDGTHLVAGPIGSEAEAETLCKRMTRVGIACVAVPFTGTPL